MSIDTCTAARTVSTVTTADGTEIVPIDAAGRASARLVKGAVLEVHPGAPHGIADTHKDRLNGNLLRFLRGGRGAIG